MTVAGVAGLFAGRLDLSVGQSQLPLEELLDVAPVLGRRAGAGRRAGRKVMAVLQTGEGADGVGLGRGLGGLAVARDLSGACC